ncbi:MULTISPECIES: GNAT family N-acetyltransferase [unclassified Microcoleus]|uniref:GNAT family N-acetyltransferase n=1 Tax=unclassified Microcoleus TaxID=2642155 RepID=UPI002FD2BE84
MTKNIQITIEAIDHTSPHLQTVIALGDANKKTLGLLPRDAFIEYAIKRTILVAIDPDKNCIGYLLYRKAIRKHAIVIVHLCINPSWRGKDVAKKLVNYLSQKTQDFYRIELKCRRDYGIDGMWYKLGFVPLDEKTGKSKDGKLLTVWWLEHNHPTIFSYAANQKLESKLCAVIDTSVFLELHGNEELKTTESDSLLADWLQDDLELCITDEIFNYINTIDDAQLRNSKRSLANTFTHLLYDKTQIKNILDSITQLLAEQSITFDRATTSQLAMIIASDSQVFVTRNTEILNLADELYRKFTLEVISPTNLILKFDDIRRNVEYQPVRLAGTFLKMKIIQKFEESRLIESFYASEKGENEGDFQQRLRHIIANKNKFQCCVFLQNENIPLALIVFDRQENYELKVTIMRIRSGAIAATLARYLVFYSLSLSAHENRQFTRIIDPYLEKTVLQAIQEDAFVRVNDGYMKANIAVAKTSAELSKYLAKLAAMGQEYNFCLKIAETLNTKELTQDLITISELERHLWPAKIIDADLPAFIIPIQPRWAKDLFDEELANQYLFDSQSDLALRRELVYYKRNNGGLKPRVIGRILWYVSSDTSFTLGTQEVKACSRLEEVIIDKPENLYRQFRSLGVYELKNLNTIAKNQPDRDIMAIRFSYTEIFTKPLTLKRLREILGNQTTVQSLFKISKEQFAIIYNEGTAK